MGTHGAHIVRRFRKGWAKIPMRNHYAPIRMAKIKNSDNKKSMWGCRETGSLYIASGNVKCFSLSRKQFDSFLWTKHAVTIWPAIAHLGLYRRKRKTNIPIKTYTLRFITALYVIAKNFNQPKRDEWLNKLWYLYHLYYSGFSRQTEPIQEIYYKNLLMWFSRSFKILNWQTGDPGELKV